MHTTILTALLALTAAATATAIPTNATLAVRDQPHGKGHGKGHGQGHGPGHGKGHGSSGDTFAIHVTNKCPWTKQFGLYSINSAFAMTAHGNPVNIPTGGTHTFHPSFHATGMRLSGHAERGTAGQWGPQALFEFGFSTYAGTTGTAYDLSVMTGSEGDVGVGAWPIRNGRGSEKCEGKVCWPGNCAPAQGWTDPGQTGLGSPADTVCYYGKTDFKVVFCP